VITSLPPSRLQRIKIAVDRVLGTIVSVFMAALVVDVIWQVVTRFFLAQPSSFTDELARFLLIWVGLLGAAYAVGQRLHLAIDLISDRVDARRRQLLGVMIELVVLTFAVGVLLVGGWRLMALTLLLGQTSASLGVPLGYVYSVLPLSGAIMSFYALVFITEHLRAFRAPSELSAELGPDPVPHATATSTGYE
jgi:TRAP-type C4-dicarboxylate transport system permease small subunit